jgi:hypothetical protein
MDAASEEKKWMQELYAMRGQIDELRFALRTVEDWVWEKVVGHDVLPRRFPQELQPAFERIKERLGEIESNAGISIDRYSDRPRLFLTKAYPLSEEYFYVLQAMGLFRGITKGLNLSPVSDFEAFMLMRYEDEQRRGYINPAESPRKDGMIGIRFGAPPEEINRSDLRPEQLEFFQQYLPQVYARFASGSPKAGATKRKRKKASSKP